MHSLTTLGIGLKIAVHFINFISGIGVSLPQHSSV